MLGGVDPASPIEAARLALALEHLDDLLRLDDQMLVWIAKCDPRLYRAYLLKEGLRTVFVLKGEAGTEALDRGSPGRGGAASPLSSNCNARSRDTALGSTPPSNTDSPTRSSNRPTPRSGSSHASHSGSVHPTRSSFLAMLALGGNRSVLPGRA
jgi:hypothetical protein